MSYNKDLVQKMLGEGKTTSQIISAHNLKPMGGNYDTFYRFCRKNEIDCHQTSRPRDKTEIFNFRKIDIEIIKKTISENFSMRSVIKKLNYNPNNNQLRRYLDKFIDKNNIDVSHFTGQVWNKGKKMERKNVIEYYLVLDCKSKMGNQYIKQRLLEEKIFEHKCYNCNNTEWMGEKISLELHHKNGNNRDNRLENIILLCPNCHAQTNNYRRRKMVE